MFAMTCTAVDLARGEQPPGEFVGRRGAVGVGDRAELLVTHPENVRFVSNRTMPGVELGFSLTAYQLTHRAGTLAAALSGIAGRWTTASALEGAGEDVGERVGGGGQHLRTERRSASALAWS